MQTHPAHTLLALIPALIGWGALATASYTVAWIFFGLAAVLALLVCIIAPRDSAAHLLYEKREYLRAVSDADPQARDMLGLKYPQLRLIMSGAPSITVADSGVSLRYFRQFLLASNREYIVPEGRYGDKTIERRQWLLWKAWLADNEYIYPDRSRANVTWGWKSPAHFWRLHNQYVRLHVPDELIPEQVEAPDGAQRLPANPAEAELMGEFR